MMSSKQLWSLSGRVALVTGGAKGIGRGIALRLAEAGARVCLVDPDEEGARRVAREVETDGGRAQVLGVDVSRPADCARAVQACVEALGGLDILVNNAGIFPVSPALETTEELWDRVLDVNLKGAFFFAQAAARHMKSAGGGSIVNVSSIDALHPAGALAHYDASKGGLSMLTRSLALELAPHHIRVNTVCPGAITTPGAEQAMARMGGSQKPGAEVRAAFTSRIPLRRMGEPDDIARAVLFLASGASDYVTGASLVVDGGYLLS